MTEGREYRLSWELHVGGDQWYATERVTDAQGFGSDIFEQARTLREWEEKGDEGVRNVKLEYRDPPTWTQMEVPDE